MASKCLSSGCNGMSWKVFLMSTFKSRVFGPYFRIFLVASSTVIYERLQSDFRIK